VIAERLQKLVDEMVDRGVQFEDAIQEFEKRFITSVLGRCDGSLSKTAGTLGIHRNTLARKMGVYKIKRPARLGAPELAATFAGSRRTAGGPADR
jgi:DNA-binding NtrC family response regulator